jgi:hypothetical protein
VGGHVRTRGRERERETRARGSPTFGRGKSERRTTTVGRGGGGGVVVVVLVVVVGEEGACCVSVLLEVHLQLRGQAEQVIIAAGLVVLVLLKVHHLWWGTPVGA